MYIIRCIWVLPVYVGSGPLWVGEGNESSAHDRGPFVITGLFSHVHMNSHTAHTHPLRLGKDEL